MKPHRAAWVFRGQRFEAGPTDGASAPAVEDPAPAVEHSGHDLRTTAVQGITWTFLRSVSSRLVGSAVFIVLARMLEPADFGTVALASVFVVLISVLVESGFAEALIQRDQVTPKDLNTAFWVNNAIGIALATVLIVFADVIAEPLGQPQLAPVLRVLSAVFIFAALASVPQAILRRELAFRAIAVRGVAATLAGGAVGIAMAIAGAGVWSLVGQMVANAAVGTVILWAMCSWRPGRSVSSSSLRELLRFSGKILGERLALFASRRSDDLLIGLVLGPVALGLYTVAYRILLILTETIIWTIEGVAFPMLSRLQNDRARRTRAFCSLTRLCAAVTVPVFLALVVLAPELTQVAFGPRWLAAIPLMQALALVGIPHAAVYCNKAALNAAGRPDLSLRIALLTCVITVIAFALVVHWGVLAVAVSFAVCSYLLVPVSLWSAIRVLDLDAKTYLRLFVAPLLSGGVMALLMLGVKAFLPEGLSEPLRLLVLVAVALAAYLAMLSLTAWREVKGALSQARRVFGPSIGASHTGVAFQGRTPE
jgi:PST family polysaccharide transporter